MQPVLGFSGEIHVTSNTGPLHIVPVSWDMTMSVDFDPIFQTVTFTEILFDAQPTTYEFPGFSGNVSLTVDEMTMQWTDWQRHLNPVSGQFYDRYFNWNGGAFDFAGQWDNYSLHTQPSYSGGISSFAHNQTVIVDPSEYPESLLFTVSTSSTQIAWRQNIKLDLGPVYSLDRVYAINTEGNLDIVLSPARRSDADDDGDVDITDFNMLAANFDPSGAEAPHPWSHGNFDGDLDTDITDFNVLSANFAPGGYSTSALSAVPEPSAIFVLALGVMAVLVLPPCDPPVVGR